MKSIPVSRGIITATNDVEIGNAEKFMEESLGRIFENNGKLMEICMQFGQNLGLAETSYFALIHSSNGINTGIDDIEFFDDDKIRGLKDLIKVYDGVYGAVLADIPNPENRIAYPKKSFLIMRHRLNSCSFFGNGPEGEFKLVTPYPYQAVVDLEFKSHE